MHKVSIIGDGLITSGFANATRQVAEGFLRLGWEVAWLGVMDSAYPDRETLEKYWYWPVERRDQLGFSIQLQFLIDTKPDVIFIKSDPGTLASRLDRFSIIGLNKRPIIAYFPVEGLPISPVYGVAANSVSYPITYCKFGSEALYNQYGVNCDWAWLGLDHADFGPLDPMLRCAVREKLGWTNRFVVTCVGTNKRSNRYPEIIRAIGNLVQSGYDDIFAYLHTSPQPLGSGDDVIAPVMAGWPLTWLTEHYKTVDRYGVNHVIFPPKYKNNAYAVYRGADYDKSKDVEYALSLRAETEEERQIVLSLLDYKTRLGISDVFLDAASVHGFNLPLGEAIACGVPAISVNDGLCRSEVFGDVALMMEPSMTVDHWHTGSQLKLVPMEAIEEAIIDLYADGKRRDRMSMGGIEWAKGVKWETPVNMITEAAKHICG